MKSNAIQELTKIIQKAANATLPEEQVHIIVTEISTALSVDVCSLYKKNADDSMGLVATYGLSTQHPVTIPPHKGLVGQVVKLRHSINIKNPASNPDYFRVPHLPEEKLKSFCGVPVVDRGQVIGVLLVQSHRPEVLDGEQEAFLTTLASHLALLISMLPAQKKVAKTITNDRRQGIRGASGVAIGFAKIITAEGLMAVPDRPSRNIEKTLEEWNQLKTVVTTELKEERSIIESTLGDNLAAVLDAHQMLLDDPSFSNRITDEIRSKKSLPWAIKQTVSFFSEQFLAMDDPYLRARHEDIIQLGEKLYQVWQGGNRERTTNENQAPTVLVGNHVGISDIVSLPAGQLKAIVCFEGAALSHIAVFANALGIPAVMGVGKLPIKEGERLIVDGENAQVILKPGKMLLREYRLIVTGREAFDSQLLSLRDLPATTTDGTNITLLANSGLQADIMPGINKGAEGLGLYRTEIPFMIRQTLPSEDEQVSVYQQVIDAYKEKPVFIRTLDIGADKALPYLPPVKEDNPALGWRGIRFTLDNLQLLITQYRAIMRAASAKPNVHVLLPMISSTDELDQCIELLNEAYQQLLNEGETVSRPKLGVMIEVPSTIPLLPRWKDKIDFISVGSNDLSQYLLAVDRNNPLVAKIYDPLHPAVVHELARICIIARECELPICLCGEMASDPIAVMLLLGMGFRKLSMSSAKLPSIKWLIRSLSIQDTENFFHAASGFDKASSIREYGQELLNTMNASSEVKNKS